MSDQEQLPFVVLVLSADDWAHLNPLLEQGNDTEVKVNVGRQRFPNVRARRLGILVHGAQIVGVCLARYLSWSGDVDYMAGIEYLRSVPPTRVEEIVRQVRRDAREPVATAFRDGAALGRVESDLVESALRNDLVIDATIRGLLERLGAVIDMSSHVAQIRAQQRDAVALALEVAGLNSKQVLQRADLALTSDLPPEPYLRGIEEESSGERAIIRHDWHSFDGWVLESATVDRVVFSDPATGAEKITITYADSTRLERITGTDLIYRRTTQPGYVLVQYKQMRREGSRNVYRPDNQLHAEIERMREFSSDDGEWLENLHDYRLSPEAFYMKVVDPEIHRIENRVLAEGMYFPLSIFERMLADNRFLGPRNGWHLTTRNAPKYLTNDLFIKMLQGGWIGTVGRTTEDMTRMIQQRLTELDRGAVIAEYHAETRATQRSRHWARE